MIIINVLLIIFAVFVGLFLFSLLIYFFNLDMKFAAKVTPLMIKFYDWKKKRNSKL